MEGTLEVNDFCSILASTSRHIFANFPIHGGFQSILNGQCPTFDKEIAVQGRQTDDTREGLDESRILHCIDIGIRDFHPGSRQEILFYVWSSKVRMVETDWLRGIESVEIEQFASCCGIDKPRASAFNGVKHQLEPVDEDMLFKLGHDFGRLHCAI